MIITEIKKAVRPDTTNPFFNQTTKPDELGVRGQQLPFINDGRLVVSVVLSDDELQQTTTSQFSSLEVYSQIDTILSIELDYAYRTYAIAHNFNQSVAQQYTQSGIDVPFTCTTTYSFGSDINEVYPLFSSFIDVLESSNNLESFTNTGSQLIAVHHYLTSADFTENHWTDFYLAEALYNAGITRTIKYELV